MIYGYLEAPQAFKRSNSFMENKIFDIREKMFVHSFG